MLKGIPSNIDSSLLKVLAEMGHGDTIAIVDHFYPAFSRCGEGCVCEAKGNTVPQMVESILKLIPLDSGYTECPVVMIKPDLGMEHQLTTPPETWQQIADLVKEQVGDVGIRYAGRTDFYEEAQCAYATVSTSDDRPYSCVILQKGVS